MQDFTNVQKIRLVRAKKLLLLAECGELPILIFYDEKAFLIQQLVNKQDNWVYLSEGATWKAGSSVGHQNSKDCDCGIKINSKYYQKSILEGVLIFWVRKHFEHRLETTRKTSLAERRGSPPNFHYKIFGLLYNPLYLSSGSILCTKVYWKQ